MVVSFAPAIHNRLCFVVVCGIEAFQCLAALAVFKKARIIYK